MSETIRKYETIKENMGEPRDMMLTAFVGGQEFGASIQFNIGSEHACLSQQQLLDMIAVMAKRLNHEDGFTATGYTTLIIVKPNGEKVLAQEDA